MSPPDKIEDPTPASETPEKQPAAPAVVTTRTTVIEQSTATSITVSKSTEASNDAPAVPEIEMSWNPPPDDDDMANDTEECQAMIEDDDDDDIMEVEHISNDVPLSKVPSPVRSDSSGGNEAGPSRRSSTPPIELRRSSRRSSRSSTERWPTTFDDDDNEGARVYEPASRNTTPEEPGSSAALVHKLQGKTYGGMPAITWKEYRRNMSNFEQKCYYAKDLPHALQDHINDMSPYTQMMGGMRDLFQAMMLENTVEDEPDAPPIEIQNGVDEEDDGEAVVQSLMEDVEDNGTIAAAAAMWLALTAEEEEDEAAAHASALNSNQVSEGKPAEPSSEEGADNLPHSFEGGIPIPKKGLSTAMTRVKKRKVIPEPDEDDEDDEPPLKKMKPRRSVRSSETSTSSNSRES